MVDNTQTQYYQTNGYHEDDDTADMETEYCRYEIQEHAKTKLLRIKHFGNFYDSELEDKINKEMQSIKNKKEKY